MSSFSIEPNPRVTFGVRYEDADLLIVEKPSGVVSQPGIGHLRDTLLNGLFARFGQRLQNLGSSRDFGLVHRLDRETSGLIAVALSVRAYAALTEAFRNRTIHKFYWAVTRRTPSRPSGVIRLSIQERVARVNKYTSTKTANIAKGGKPALTAYRVLASTETGALIEARPVTGRLHQIRVHLNAIGAPVLGDPVYGPHISREGAHRLALHAHRLVLDHPISGKPVKVETAWPRDLRGLLRHLGIQRPDLRAQDGSIEDPSIDGSEASRESRSEGAHEIARDAVGDEESAI